MKTTCLAFAALAVFALSSCEKKGLFCAKGNGNIITENRSVTGFDGIELSIGATVHIEQSATWSVSVTTSENLMDVIKTEVQGSTLTIGTHHKKCLTGNNKIDIWVTLPELRQLAISGSGDITGPHPISTPGIELSISGSGNIYLDSLQAGTCVVEISGSGNVKLAGQHAASKQTIHISGSGDVKSLEWMSTDTEVHISGSGRAEVYCTDHLDAEISGSGDILYKGQPLITFSGSGSGTVKPY